MSEPFLSLPLADGIPEKRARFLFRVRSEKARADDEQLAATQSHGVLSQKRYMEITGNKVVAALAGTDNFNHVGQDDFVISLRTFEGGIERATEPGCISPAYTVLAPLREVEPAFFQYLLKSQVFISHLQTTVTGIRDGKSVKFENFANIVLPVPDLETQRQIADFLDRETARIDLLIEKKQRLVALLGEKAASEVDLLIDGTHPRYANTPTEYAERTNYKLKMLCSRLGNGFVGPTRDILVEEDETDAVPYLQSTHVKNRKIDFQRKPYFVTKGWLNTKPKAQVRQDDLVIVQTGDCGATAIIDEEFHGSGCHAMIITRPKPDRILPRYLLQVLCSRSGREMLAAIQTGALHPHLEVGFVKDVSIPTPPRSVQDEILCWIENELDALERIQEKTQTSIDRLKEYRSALITAAVTGQIDVSTYAKSGTPDRRLDAIQEEMGA